MLKSLFSIVRVGKVVLASGFSPRIDKFDKPTPVNYLTALGSNLLK